MAQILRHGKTPLWGAYKENDSGWDGVIIDSYNYSVEVKDYEQLDEVGRVKGYLIYDQTVNYDMSGTILMPLTEATCAINTVNLGCNFRVGFNHTPTITALTNGINTALTNPTTAITKSFSINTSQGSAVTFSTSGSIYDFSEN